MRLEMHDRRRRARARTTALYAWSLLNEFRATLWVLGVALAAGTLLYHLTPHVVLDGRPPGWGLSLLSAWMALLAQNVVTPVPETWYLGVVTAVYPLVGIVVIGEGVVRLALLLLSRRTGQEQWMKIMASTYRDHILLCGLGNLGMKVLEQLLSAGANVVVLEKDGDTDTLARARELDVPILIRNMREDQALVDAGIEHARAVVICTNNDMANIEVALDARRLNPGIRVIMRMIDEQISDKVASAFLVDHAFSAASVTAPLVAALCLDGKVLSTCVVDGVQQVIVETPAGGAIAGMAREQIEKTFEAKVLSGDGVKDGGKLVLYMPANRVGEVMGRS